MLQPLGISASGLVATSKLGGTRASKRAQLLRCSQSAPAGACLSDPSYRPQISSPPHPGSDGELSDVLWCKCRGCCHLTLASFQPGPGQSGGCHGFDSAHDPAYITHPASRDRADPLHNGLAFFNVRASISHTPPCPVQWRKKKKNQRSSELPFVCSTATTVPRRGGSGKRWKSDIFIFSNQTDQRKCVLWPET